MNSKTLALGAIVVLAASANAQVTKQGAGYLLRAKYSKGQVIRFNTSNKVRGATAQPGSAIDVTIPITMRVLDVKSGIATVQLKLGEAKLGQSVINPGQTAVVRLNSRNEGTGTAGGANVAAALPAKAVKVGQTWTATAPISTGMGPSQNMKATYKFQGLKSVGGRQVAVITYSVTGFAKGNGTMRLLTSDGTIFDNLAKFSISASGSPVSVNSEMKRVGA